MEVDVTSCWCVIAVQGDVSSCRCHDLIECATKLTLGSRYAAEPWRCDTTHRGLLPRSHSVADSNVREFDSTDDARNGSLPRFEGILCWCEPTCWVLGRALTSVCKRRTVATPRGVDVAGFAGRKGLYVTFNPLNISPCALHCAIAMLVRQCLWTV